MMRSTIIMSSSSLCYTASGKHIKSSTWFSTLSMYPKFMQISIRNHVGKCALLCFYTIFKRWHNSKCLVGEKKENNDNAGPLLLDVNGTYFGFLRKDKASFPPPVSSWHCCVAEGAEEKGVVLSELDLNCPPGRLRCDWHLSPLCLRHSN